MYQIGEVQARSVTVIGTSGRIVIPNRLASPDFRCRPRLRSPRYGFVNGAAIAKPDLGGPALASIVATVFVLVAIAAGIVAPLRAVWGSNAVRVAGSWIAATGLLLLGGSLRGAG